MKRRRGVRKTIFITILFMVLAGCASFGKNGALVECGEGTKVFDKGTVVVVAMHGIPPLDSGLVLAEFMMLEAQLNAGSGSDDPKKVQRLKELDEKLKNWPLRANRPYHVGALKLGRLLEERTGTKVFVGYNEFCAPSLDKAFEDAANEKPKKIMVITTLSAPGNDHAQNPEGDVLESVLNARGEYPDIDIVCAWPYRYEKILSCLCGQLCEFKNTPGFTGH